jgi:hypothetical protein
MRIAGSIVLIAVASRVSWRRRNAGHGVMRTLRSPANRTVARSSGDRSTDVLSPTAIAEAVTEAYAQQESRRAWRRVAAVGVLAVVTVGSPLIFLAHRTPLPVSASSRPTLGQEREAERIALHGREGHATVDLTADAYSIAILGRHDVPPSVLLAPVRIEFLLPVPSSACARVAEETTLECHGRTLSSRDGIVLAAKKPLLTTLHTTSVDHFQLRMGAPVTGSIAAVTSRGLPVVRIRCLEPTRIRISPTVGSPAGVTEDCALSDMHSLRLQIDFGRYRKRRREDGAPILLGGLRSLHLRSRADTARLALSQMNLSLGTEQFRLFGPQTPPVAVTATNQGGVAVDADVLGRSGSTAFVSLGSTRAGSVMFGSREQVPTSLHKYRDIWVAVVIMVVGIVLALIIDAIPVSQRLTRRRK